MGCAQAGLGDTGYTKNWPGNGVVLPPDSCSSSPSPSSATGEGRGGCEGDERATFASAKSHTRMASQGKHRLQVQIFGLNALVTLMDMCMHRHFSVGCRLWASVRKEKIEAIWWRSVGN